MAYDKERFKKITSKSSIDLIEFMVVRAIVVSEESPEAIEVDAGIIYDNEFIWAKEELEKRLK